MRKRKVRNQVTALFLSMCVLTGSIGIQSFAAAEEATGGEVLAEVYREQLLKQEEEMEEVPEEIVELEGELNEVYTEIEEEMTIPEKTVKDDTVYEDYYAGAYLDENEKMVICVTKDFNTETKNDETILNEIQEAESVEDVEALEDNEELDTVDVEDDIKYRTVKYSYNELSEMQTYISEKQDELSEHYTDKDSVEYDLLHTISSIGIDVEKNMVDVTIVDISEEKIDTFRALFGDYENIGLKNGERMPEDNTAYKPGRAIYVISKKSGSTVLEYSQVSIGYRAYRKTSTMTKPQYGFVTCGHGVIKSVDNNIYHGTGFGVVIGKRRISRNRGTVDASFVEIGAKHSVSMTVKYSGAGGETENADKITPGKYIIAYLPGLRLYKVGASSHLTSGKIIDADVATEVSNVKFSNMVLTDIYSRNGDSGGIVYATNKLPAGIVKGSFDGIFTMYFTRGTEVYKTLSGKPY